jgi:UDP-glucose 4-epimerase
VKRILLTGSNGFVGRGLSLYLKSLGFDVVDVFYGKQLVISDDQWKMDLTDTEHVAAIQELDFIPDIIIHLAGYIDIDLKPHSGGMLKDLVPGCENISKIYSANVLTTANVLYYALKKNVNHIIYASSQAVYGMPKDDILYENSYCEPLEHYAASKLFGEKMLKLGSKNGLKVTVLRFPGVYGFFRRRGIVWNFCRSALLRKKIIVDFDIPVPFDCIHLDDVLNAFGSAINSHTTSFSCFNISHNDPCNINMLANIISNLVPGCTIVDSSVWQPIVHMDASKAKKILKWQAYPRKVRLQSFLKGVQDAL